MNLNGEYNFKHDNLIGQSYAFLLKVHAIELGSRYIDANIDLEDNSSKDECK